MRVFRTDDGSVNIADMTMNEFNTIRDSLKIAGRVWEEVFDGVERDRPEKMESMSAHDIQRYVGLKQKLATTSEFNREFYLLDIASTGNYI